MPGIMISILHVLLHYYLSLILQMRTLNTRKFRELEKGHRTSKRQHQSFNPDLLRQSTSPKHLLVCSWGLFKVLSRAEKMNLPKRKQISNGNPSRTTLVCYMIGRGLGRQAYFVHKGQPWKLRPVFQKKVTLYASCSLVVNQFYGWQLTAKQVLIFSSLN